jgi:hypothetical protein
VQFGIRHLATTIALLSAIGGGQLAYVAYRRLALDPSASFSIGTGVSIPYTSWLVACLCAAIGALLVAALVWKGARYSWLLFSLGWFAWITFLTSVTWVSHAWTASKLLGLACLIIMGVQFGVYLRRDVLRMRSNSALHRSVGP